MSNILGSAWWLLVTLGVLVTFHEYGHFIVARKLGVKVLRFSIGFGRPLWSRMGKDGTEYVIAAIPLGGYVKFLDEREGDVPAADIGREFNRKPLGSRMAIVAAGPVFNLIFAFAAFWLMFVIGKPDYEPTIAAPTGIAATAGFVEGDRIEAIGDQPIGSWSRVILALAENALSAEDIVVTVQDKSGQKHQRKLPISQLGANVDGADALDRIGLMRKPRIASPSVIGSVTSDSPAEAAGIQVNDRIAAINGKPIATWEDLVKVAQAEAANNPLLAVEVDRSGHREVLAVKARFGAVGDSPPRWTVGIGPLDSHDVVLQFGPLDAIPAAFNEAVDMTRSSLKLLKLMITGKAKASNVSGPISIAQYANDAAKLGFAWFLHFLGLISLSLAIMNLLPIPILDGGHLLYYLIELVKGSPVSERTLVAGQYVGLTLLMALMGLAFYNDLFRHAF